MCELCVSVGCVWIVALWVNQGQGFGVCASQDSESRPTQTHDRWKPRKSTCQSGSSRQLWTAVASCIPSNLGRFPVETSFFLVTARFPTKKRELRGNTVASDAVEQAHLSGGRICKLQKIQKDGVHLEVRRHTAGKINPPLSRRPVPLSSFRDAADKHIPPPFRGRLHSPPSGKP